MRTFRSRAARLALTLALLALCVVSVLPAAAQTNRGSARIGFVHGTVNAPNLDVYVDGELTVDELAYGASSDLVRLPAGRREIAVTEAGRGLDDAIASSAVNVAAGNAYAAGVVGRADEAELRLWQVDLSPTKAGQARVRVIHASPDAPGVDIAVAGGDVLFAGATFTEAPPATEVDAGTYNLEMRPEDSADVVQAISDVTFAPGTSCTVFALGLLEDNGSLEILTFVNPLNGQALPGTGAGAARPVGTARRGVWVAAALAASAGAAAVARRGRRVPA